jgi:hypothetical protein
MRQDQVLWFFYPSDEAVSNHSIYITQYELMCVYDIVFIPTLVLEIKAKREPVYRSG